MKLILAAVLCFAVIFTLSACQPTPEQAVVVQKDSDALIEQAQKTPAESPRESAAPSLSEQYGIPETYAFDAQGADGNLTIHADAQVIVPEGSSLPIYRVKAAEFSQDTVSAFFDALCGDAEMWINSGQRTKEQIQEQILGIKRDLEQGAVPEDMVEEAQQVVEMLEGMVETAPETIVEERADGTMREMRDTPPEEPAVAAEGGAPVPTEAPPAIVNTYTGLEAYEQYNGGGYGSGRAFYVRNDDSPALTYADFRNPAGGVNFGSSPSLPILSDSDVDAAIISEIGLKPSEAVQTVQELLDSTGSGMAVDSIYLQDDEQFGNYDGIVRPAEQYAYKVYCVRLADGISCSCISGASQPENDMTAPYWMYESFEVMVNSEGIFDLMWSCPLEIVETVNTDAQIKPFSEIREIFESMMLIKYEPQAEYSDMEFEINRVTLSLNRIIERNSNESGLLIPAWNFYGKLIIGTDAPGAQYEMLGESFLTINAIDGSVIDTNKGY